MKYSGSLDRVDMKNGQEKGCGKGERSWLGREEAGETEMRFQMEQRGTDVWDGSGVRRVTV